MGATYKLKRKLADGTLEDVILQGAGGGVDYNQVEISYEDVSDVEYDDDTVFWDTELILRNTADASAVSKPINIQLPLLAGNGIEFTPNSDKTRLIISATGGSGGGGGVPFTMEESNYSFAVGEEIDLEVYATDGMPQHIEIYVYQDVGNDQPLNLQLYNQEGDTIDIPYTYGGEYSIIVKPNASNFDIYILRANGGMTYLGSMCMEYIYLNSPSALDGVSHDTEITVKYCWLNTIV